MMMEETNDEQPEIVTHEEVALAEKEAAQSSAGETVYSPGVQSWYIIIINIERDRSCTNVRRTLSL